MRTGELIMDKISKSRWQVRTAALIIFLLGVAAGGLGVNAYRAWSRGDAQASREGRFAQLAQRLNLNEDQKSQVQKILGETREQLRALRKESEPRVKEIRQQADANLQKVLTPEQWQQFQQMREETRGKGRRGRGNGGGDSLTGDR
jgi:DNA anti-recombination protein RmuC